MKRVLSIGSKLDFADQNVEWHESANYKDYNIIFLNLQDLEERSGQFSHPYFDNYRAVNFPTRREVHSFVMQGGNDLIIILPSSAEIELKGDDQPASKKPASQQTRTDGTTAESESDRDEYEVKYHSCDPFKWLPVRLSVEAAGGESVSIPTNHVVDLWRWYFSSNFRWDLTIQKVRRQSSMTEQSTYRNPNSRRSYSSGRSSSKTGPLLRTQDLAVNASSESIATRIELFPREEVDISRLSEYNPMPGGIYLVPLKPSMAFSDFARQVLIQNYGLLDEGLEHQPDWVQNYTLPEEKQILDRISVIESELEDLNEQIQEPIQYKPLLYQIGDPLEQLVRESLRDVGLELSGEVPGKRDGVIKLPEKWISLEIFGTVNGVKARKYRQLTDWVENVQVEYPDKDVEGLLIANIFAEDDPKERPADLLQGDPKRLMEQRGFHAISTIDLYRMICGYRNDDLTTEDIENTFSNMADLVIDFEGLSSDPI